MIYCGIQTVFMALDSFLCRIRRRAHSSGSAITTHNRCTTGNSLGIGKHRILRHPRVASLPTHSRRLVLLVPLYLLNVSKAKLGSGYSYFIDYCRSSLPTFSAYANLAQAARSAPYTRAHHISEIHWSNGLHGRGEYTSASRTLQIVPANSHPSHRRPTGRPACPTNTHVTNFVSLSHL